MHDNTTDLSRHALIVPDTVEEAIDPDWLTAALASESGGARVISVELVNVFKTMASKVRIAVRFENDPDRTHGYCLKAFLGWDRDPTTIKEADFYSQIAPQLSMRVPYSPGSVIDREAQRGMLIMEDLIAAGAHFCSALEPFTVELVQQSLDQIARLHAKSSLLEKLPWVPCRIQTIANRPVYSLEKVQGLLDDPRGNGMHPQTRDASLLFAAMTELAKRNAAAPQTLLHGDCHAGNLYLTADGPGVSDWQLIQHGNWAFDVAYHINALLPVDVAEREERMLLDHYLDCLARHGGEPLGREAAWADYRSGVVYGFYHWAISTSVIPEIINIVTDRLGSGVTRHDSYRLLGLV